MTCTMFAAYKKRGEYGLVNLPISGILFNTMLSVGFLAGDAVEINRLPVESNAAKKISLTLAIPQLSMSAGVNGCLFDSNMTDGFLSFSQIHILM